MTGAQVNVALVVLTALVGAPAGAFAQRSVQVPLEFNFINPGAKSMAMAGAFVAVADDATASFANPAGLTFLAAPEVSIELRGGRTVSPFLAGGRLSGAVTHEGIDTIAGPSFLDSVDKSLGISYASFVYPHSSNRWVIAGYRHELMNSEQSMRYDGAFGQVPGDTASQRDLPLDGTRDLTITGYGAAGAYKVTRDLSIGGALVIYDFDLDAEFKRYFLDDFFAPVNREVTIDELRNYGTQIGSGLSVAPVVGVTYDHGGTRFGAVYRHGASFDFDIESFAIPPKTYAFRVPHTFSAGLSRRLSPQWLVSGEVTYLSYSRLTEEFITSQVLGVEEDFQIHSGTEVHGAVQYAWRRGQGPPIRLRAGAWYDPDHSVKYEPVSPPATPQIAVAREVPEAALSRGSNRVHVSGGIGWTVTPRLEFNAGVDVAERSTQVSTSLIVHLGRTP